MSHCAYVPRLLDSVSAHLDRFHALAFVSSAAMNIGVHVSLQIIILSGYVPRSGVAGSYDNSIFSFRRKHCTVLHIGCTSVHSHQQCKRGSLFSTLSPAFVICRLFSDGHSDHGEVVCHCSFDLHFSNYYWCWASFHVLLGHLYVVSGH